MSKQKIEFVPRFEVPEPGNPYYNTKDNGGYSTALKGKYKLLETPDENCNVLPNCVGYSFGRMNEIVQNKKMTVMKSLYTKDWIDYALSKGYKVGDTPYIGAAMIWHKTDGEYGHVCIVEEVIDENTIITSESGYMSEYKFWTTKRVKGKNENWSAPPDYVFDKFIYHPQFTPQEVQTDE